MNRHRKPVLTTTLLILAGYLAAFTTPTTHAAPSEGFADASIRAIWQRDDGPVASGRTQRPWMWGPSPFYTNYEPYREAREGNHLVQYFDKGRLEINDPGADKSSAWYVTSGLLVKEMVSGRAQVGDTEFYDIGPAEVRLAGEATDSPTYATFARLTGRVAPRDGQAIVDHLDADGRVVAITPPSGSSYTPYEPASGHNWAATFWAFAHNEQRAATFDWLATLGYPISEPYWISATIRGKHQEVLVQLFERRLLTFSPANPAATQVEMGNVGRHYYQWRYAARHAANLDTHYDVRISVGPVPQRITQIVEDLAFTNRTGRTMDRVVLHAPWHHWDGVLTLRSATAQGSPAAARWREDINLEVALPVPVAAGGQVSLSLSFDARPRPVGGRTGYDRTNDILCLGDMLPTLVPWENGGWSYFPYSELGDLGFYETSSYEVEISSTGGERLIVGGAGSLASVDDARTRWRFEALQVRDVAYIISPHFMDPRTNSSMTRQAGSTRILAYFPPEHQQDGRRQLDLVAPAVSWFSRTLGAYPFDTYTVAEMGIPLKRTDNYAQEYPMSYWIPTPWLRLGTTPGSWTWYTPVHEVGHQWFYSLIGNNQLTDPWLDEAMTSYITAEYVRANFPDQYQSTWSSTTIRPGKAKPVSAGVFSGFANENEYSATVYNSGVLMLGEVHRAMGNEAFYAALRDYYSRFKYRRATPADLIGVLQAHTGTDLSPIFGRYLGY